MRANVVLESLPLLGLILARTLFWGNDRSTTEAFMEVVALIVMVIWWISPTYLKAAMRSLTQAALSAYVATFLGSNARALTMADYAYLAFFATLTLHSLVKALIEMRKLRNS